jgi:hypothetical protein
VRRWLALCLALVSGGALLLPVVSAAVAPMVVLENSMELASSVTRWPSEANGLLLMAGCTTCQHDRYRLAHNAQFFVGQQVVDYAEFCKVVNARSDRMVFVAVWLATGEVSRATVIP